MIGLFRRSNVGPTLIDKNPLRTENAMSWGVNTTLYDFLVPEENSISRPSTDTFLGTLVVEVAPTSILKATMTLFDAAEAFILGSDRIDRVNPSRAGPARNNSVSLCSFFRISSELKEKNESDDCRFHSHKH